MIIMYFCTHSRLLSLIMNLPLLYFINVYKPDYRSIFQTSCKHTADTLLVSVINTFGVFVFFLSILKVFALFGRQRNYPEAANIIVHCQY